MRIITGTLKGRKISVPPGIDNIRPSSDRTKESMFAIIDARKHLSGSTVLDLFAGSGNLGFEALSRGAGRVVFVESSEIALKHIEKTGRQFQVEERTQCICSSVEGFLDGPSQPFDFVFADPPYDYDELQHLPETVLKDNWLKDKGWFLLEHDKRHRFDAHPHCVFSKPYGRTIVTIFTRELVPADT
ncbi:MAG: 16S rRNA (guanine(966)-N(2))-methyltransferase RsmD [Balneolales bacterium]